MAKAVNIPVIASGGVSTVDDIRRLKALDSDGMEGAILGKALYIGSLTLKDALEAAWK
jgi:phosphoribosylformimino-5-aminoimidazole carboxamide ribotide isomerase